MIWVFFILGSLFAGFFGLGALTVWTSVLMLAFKASVVVIAALTILLLFSMFVRR
jgi:hypothetical protein